MLPRHLLSWKTAFYDLLPPLLRRLGASRGDAALAWLGRVVHRAWPARRRVVREAAARVGARLGARPEQFRSALAANVARFLARDYRLDGLADVEALGRFDVRGGEHLDAALGSGRGSILLGSHFGAHVSALHWLYRRDVPLRLLVQRPRHVSRYLQNQFDREGVPHPQAGLFLRRGLPPREAADRLLRARAALRDGLAVYLSGDIPWSGVGGRPGRLLGHERPFLATWADLAAVTGAPVVAIYAEHRPGGRYALTLDPPVTVEFGGEDEAVARYLARLDARIAADPADAVAHLTWPCYVDPEGANSWTMPPRWTRSAPRAPSRTARSTAATASRATSSASATPR